MITSEPDLEALKRYRLADYYQFHTGRPSRKQFKMEASKGMFFILLAVFVICAHGQIGVQRSDVCNLDPEIGSCRAFLPSFYFNKNIGMCDCFIYGGCNNGLPLNLFDSLQKCVDSCGVNPKLQIVTDTCKELFRTRDSEANSPKFNETVIARLQEIFNSLGSGQSNQNQPSQRVPNQQQQFQPQGPSSSNQQFQPQSSQQFQTQSPSQQFQPQATSQQFQPQPSPQQFQPQPSPQQFQPQGSSQQFQPQPSPQQFQPQGSSQQFQQQSISQQFQPQLPSQQFQPQSTSQQLPSQQFQPQASSQQFQPSRPVSQSSSRPQSTSSSQSTGPVFPPPVPGVPQRSASEAAQRRQQQQLAETIRQQQEFERQQKIKEQMLLDQQRLQQQSLGQRQRAPVVTNVRNTQGTSSGSIAIGQPVRITG